MKKQLRKIMLAGFATLLAGNAYAAGTVTVTEGEKAKLTIDWEQALPTLTTGGGQSDWKDATAVKGSNEILVMNKTTKSIWSFSATEAKEVVTGLPTTPFAISCDEAGNIIFNNGGGAPSGSNTFYILPAGSRDIKDLKNLNLTLPEGITSGTRVDYLGRTLGNVLSADGGWFNTAMNTQTTICSYCIAEGKQIESFASPTLPVSLTTFYVSQPSETSVEECLNASNPSMTAYAFGGNVNSFLRPDEEFADWTKINRVQHRSAAGFDWFKLGDETYYVYGAKLEGRAATWCPNDFVIVRASDNAIVASYMAPEDTAKDAVCGGITAYANEDGKSATIYRFTSVSGATKLTFSLEEEAPTVPALYILGNESYKWDPANPDEFTYDATTKTYSFELISASYGFKISGAKGTLAEFDAAGFHINGKLAKDTETKLLNGAPDNNMNIELAQSGDYKLTVDLENMTIKATFLPVPTPNKLFVIGDLVVGCWDPAVGVELTKNGNIFEGDVALNGAYFSFTDKLAESQGNWDTVGQRFGACSDNETHFNTALPFGRGENAFNIVDITEFPKNVHIVVDFDAMTVTTSIKTTTGVEDVAVDVAAPAEYYDLHGVSVAQPEAGKLYIVKKGNKVSKMLVK